MTDMTYNTLLGHTGLYDEGEKLHSVKEVADFMLEQIRTIDKERLKNYVGRIDKQSAEAIERASLESLGIDVHKTYRRLYGK